MKTTHRILPALLPRHPLGKPGLRRPARHHARRDRRRPRLRHPPVPHAAVVLACGGHHRCRYVLIFSWS